MACVYDFIEREEGRLGSPPFQVPQMQFVQSGLAISMSEDRAAFLLEEFIDADNDQGHWYVKYLNNNSAKPRSFAMEEQVLRADFLSFAQHVQFVQTGGLAFVSDFQGEFAFLSFRSHSHRF